MNRNIFLFFSLIEVMHCELLPILLPSIADMGDEIASLLYHSNLVFLWQQNEYLRYYRTGVMTVSQSMYTTSDRNLL